MRIATPHETLAPWPSRAARWLFKRQNRPPREADNIVTAFRDGEVTLRENRRVEGFTNALAEHGYQGVRAGDLIIHSMDGFAGAIGVSDSDGKASPVVHCYQPNENIDPRFYAYLLRDAARSGFITSLAKGIRERSTAFDSETFRSLILPVPDFRVQRAIADFLDAETARIDALIAKKHRLWQLLLERRAGHIEHAIRSLMAEWGEAPLKYLVRGVTVGIVVTPAAWYAESGVPALRGQNVKPGRVILDDLVYLTEEGHGLHKKSELRSGDVVVVRTGQAGAAAVVTAEVAGANCIDLIVMRPGPAVDASFLEHVLNSDWTQKHVEQYSVGTIQSHFNVSAMKEVPVPLAPVHRQREVVKNLGRLTDRIDATVARLNRQIELLTEYRQALITAAVTGKLEVPGIVAL